MSGNLPSIEMNDPEFMIALAHYYETHVKDKDPNIQCFEQFCALYILAHMYNIFQ